MVPGSGNRTVQLNTTFVSGTLGTLRYAWRDYPSMSVFAQVGGGCVHACLCVGEVHTCTLKDNCVVDIWVWGWVVCGGVWGVRVC